MRLNSGVAVKNFFILEPTFSGNSEVEDMACAISNAEDTLFHFMLTDSGHVLTSTISISEFDALTGTHGYSFSL